MARDDSDHPRDPERKRSSSPAAQARAQQREQRASAAWSRAGRSGYGLESIRPHLRAQLEQQRLLRPLFPPDDDHDRPDPHLGRGGKR